jgi:hypothetical protein
MNEEIVKRSEKVLRHILQQIERDGAALDALEPALGWRERAIQTAEKFVPGLVATAEDLMAEVEQCLNSPEVVRSLWNELKSRLENEQFAETANAIDSALMQESKLIAVITGETVSKLIADFLCRAFGNLKENNRSTYPDLYFTDVDYSELPQRARGRAEGPARRKNNPTSIPDGIEIKSNKGERIRVDSHHHHQGLHLALTFGRAQGRFRVYDVYLAYLSKADYKRAERNTTATTEKFSFGHAPFISVTTGGVETAELVPDES